jgi:hypothetical protein
MLLQPTIRSLAVSASLVSLAIAQAIGQFISPGPANNVTTLDQDAIISLNFQYGETQVFAWNASVTTVSLLIWQHFPHSGSAKCRYGNSVLSTMLTMDNSG